MMTEIEIEIIRLALDTEIEHKDYAKHNLAAKKVLNANEAENKGQSLPIDSVTQQSELLNDFFWKYLHTKKTYNDEVEPHNIVDDYLKGVL